MLAPSLPNGSAAALHLAISDSSGQLGHLRVCRRQAHDSSRQAIYRDDELAGLRPAVGARGVLEGHRRPGLPARHQPRRRPLRARLVPAGRNSQDARQGLYQGRAGAVLRLSGRGRRHERTARRQRAAWPHDPRHAQPLLDHLADRLRPEEPDLLLRTRRPGRTRSGSHWPSSTSSPARRSRNSLSRTARSSPAKRRASSRMPTRSSSCQPSRTKDTNSQACKSASISAARKSKGWCSTKAASSASDCACRRRPAPMRTTLRPSPAVVAELERKAGATLYGGRRPSRRHLAGHRPGQERQLDPAERPAAQAATSSAGSGREVRLANDANCFAVSEASRRRGGGLRHRVRRHPGHRRGRRRS